ncbi:MAG: DUF4386 domain-containing protein [Anaerolineales bacterium]|nr:DUF4386 domain-containing protein [Anaerolineales bacterium]
MLQFMTSFSSGVFLQPKLFVPGDMHATLLKIAGNVGLMRASILLDMCTVLGVIFLGVVLYLTLRKQNETMALVGMTFYLLEGVLHAVSRMQAFALMGISQDYVAAGYPADLLTLGKLTFEAMNFLGSTLMMLAFCVGAVLFYYALYRAKIVPDWLSLWGLVTVSFLLIWTVLAILGIEVPFFLYVPYVPFEFVIGIWILVKGVNQEVESHSSPVVANAAAL